MNSHHTCASSVIDALGGTAEVARLTGRGMSSISNWRASGTIPAEFYLIVTQALASRGLTADPSVFRIVVPDDGGPWLAGAAS